MRAYTFTNFMLNTVAQGIQPAHCLMDMVRRYQLTEPDNIARLRAEDWADNHKTMICLNGGNHAGILSVWEQLVTLGDALNLPIQKFCEDQDTLGGLMTCCGIIVPAEVYTIAALRWFDDDTKGADRDGKVYCISEHINADQQRLAALIRSYPLAR